VRTVGTEQLAEELAELVQRGWDEIVVEDDNFAALPREFQRKAGEALKASGAHWNIDGGLYYPLVNEHLVSLLAENGCYRVFLPIESPDLRRMHHAHKYVEFRSVSEQSAKLQQVCALLREYNIEFYVALLIGLPGQTKQDLFGTCSFAQRLVTSLGAIGISLHWIHAYPGTEFYRHNYQKCSPSRRWQVAPEYYSFVKPMFPLEDVGLEEMEQIALRTLEKVNGTAVVNASAFFGPQRPTGVC
jgi:radical SAM superfamily enzyme YgiQ (UPF0313 family)